MRSIKTLLGVAVLGILAACGGGGSGGGGGGGSGASVSGSVFKGPVLGASVCAYAIVGGAKDRQLAVTSTGGSGSVVNGCYVTGADGLYGFTLPSDATGDFLLESTGGTFCSNEMPVAGGGCAGGGALLNLGLAAMRAAGSVPAGGGTVTLHVTPLTSAAVDAAMLGAGFSAATFQAQFGVLAGQVLGAGSGITPSTAPTSTTQPYLTQISAYLQLPGATFFGAVETLRLGSNAFMPLPLPPSPPTLGTPAPFAQATLAGSRELQFHIGFQAEGCGVACSYAEGSTATFVIDGDSLTIPGKTLTDPYHPNPLGNPFVDQNRIAWWDDVAQLEYVVSENFGYFRRIEVFDRYGRLLGHWSTSNAAGRAAIASMSGSYGLAYQAGGPSVAWSTVTLGLDGSITFSGGSGPNVTPTRIRAIEDTLAQDGVIAVYVTFDLNTGAHANGISDWRDVLLLYAGTDGRLRSISYDTGDLYEARDDTIVVVGAQAPLVPTGAALPVGNAIRGTFDGTYLETPVASVQGSATQMALIATAGGVGTKGWEIRLKPGGAIALDTPYSCRISSGEGIETSIQVAPVDGLGAMYGTNFSRCTIVLSDYQVAGDVLLRAEGRFAVEFQSGSQAIYPVLPVADGAFRYAASPP